MASGWFLFAPTRPVVAAPWPRALSHRLRPPARVLTVVLLNAPVIALPLCLNLRGATPDPLVVLYATGVVLSYAVLLPLALVAVPCVISLFTPRVGFALTGLVLTLLDYFLLLDSRVYDICHFHIDGFWIDYVWHDLAGIGLPPTTLVQAFLAVPCLIALEIGLFRLSSRLRTRRWIVPGLIGFSLIALATSQIIHVMAFERDIGRITSLTPHFPSYMPLTSHRNAVKYGDLLPIEPVSGNAAAAGETSASLRYPLRSCAANLPQGIRPLNVVFLVLESWRFDAMNDTITPNIQALARRSSDFRRHFSSGNATTTGIFSLLYGLHPTYWMAVKSNNACLHNPLLIDLMEETGYTFGIFADSQFERHKIKDAMFRDIDVHETFAGATREEKELDMTRQMLEFLRAQRDSARPFMLFAFYKASHFHYFYPDSFRVFTPARDVNVAGGNARAERLSYLNDYWNALRFDDALIGELLSELEAMQAMDETVIIVTTDHGEEFDDNAANYWGHGSNFTQYQTRVPLVFYYPGSPARVVDVPTAHVDIPTTLLRNVLGVRNDPAEYSNGRDLFAALPQERALVIASYFNHALITGEDVYAVFPVYTRNYRLDDIKKPAGKLRPPLIRTAMEEMGRFYASGATKLVAYPASVATPPAASTVGPAADRRSERQARGQ